MAEPDWIEEVEDGRLFHVSSILNRESIQSWGLDWTRMAAAPGIAGSRRPEVEGCFLALNEFEAEWFARQINNTGGPVDTWLVSGVDPSELVEDRNGHVYYPRPIPPSMLTLHIRGDAEQTG